MYLNYLNEPLLIRISDEMVPYFNVFGFRMKHWILHNTNGAFIINVNLGVHEIEPIIKHLILDPQHMSTTISSSKSTHVPIVQSLDINKSTSYAGVAGASAKDQPNVNSSFHSRAGYFIWLLYWKENGISIWLLYWKENGIFGC
ncbi:hypothetical protein Tco_0521189 [Tanacetum coccineum]